MLNSFPPTIPPCAPSIAPQFAFIPVTHPLIHPFFTFDFLPLRLQVVNSLYDFFFLDAVPNRHTSLLFSALSVEMLLFTLLILIETPRRQKTAGSYDKADLYQALLFFSLAMGVALAVSAPIYMAVQLAAPRRSASHAVFPHRALYGILSFFSAYYLFTEGSFLYDSVKLLDSSWWYFLFQCLFDSYASSSLAIDYIFTSFAFGAWVTVKTGGGFVSACGHTSLVLLSGGLYFGASLAVN